MRSRERKFDVMCICEANLKQSISRCPEYDKYSTGTMLVMVRNNVKCKIVDDLSLMTNDYEILCLDLDKFVLICAYNRSGKHTRGVKKLMDVYDAALTINDKVCIMGDLNAKMEIVRPGQGINAAGRWLDNYIDNAEGAIVVHNNSEYTFKRPNQRPSVLDCASVQKQCVL